MDARNGGGVVTVGGVLGVGYNTHGMGALIQTGGVLNVAGEFDINYQGPSAYGFYQNAGGTATNASWLQAGRTGLGLIYLTGGTNVLTGSGNGFVVGNNSSGNGTGVLYIAGGTGLAAGQLGIGWAGSSRAEATIANAAVVLGTGGTKFNQAGTTTSFLNLNSGGVLTTLNIYKNVAGGLSILNLNGGTIVAEGNQV